MSNDGIHIAGKAGGDPAAVGRGLGQLLQDGNVALLTERFHCSGVLGVRVGVGGVGQLEHLIVVGDSLRDNLALSISLRLLNALASASAPASPYVLPVSQAVFVERFGVS